MFNSRQNAWRSYAVLVLLILVGCGALRGDERAQENESESPVGTVSSPVRVGTSSYSQVEAGTHFACAVRSDGRLLCWGANTNGQLGVGDANDRAVPTLVGTATWSSVSAGTSHTCGVKTDGTLWCWGTNSFGAIGDGTTTAKNVPTQAGAATTWRSVTTGLNFTCGTQTDDTLWCWGVNNFGQLGQGSTASANTPQAIAGAWSTVTAGGLHACAVKTDGTLWCWGSNSSKQLSGAGTSSVLSPRQVGSATTWSKVAAGYVHTCASQAVSGASSVWCFGENSSSQIGNGSTSIAASPVQVATSTTAVSSLDLGPTHSCATTASGKLLCWGSNANGELGNGTGATAATPVEVGATDWASVTTGDTFTCATKTDGTLWCTGTNSKGELGIGTSGSSKVPTQTYTATPTTFSYLGAGWSHRCAVATNGDLYCWGKNESGQLGDGTLMSRVAPTFIGPGYSAVESGDAHTCAIRTDGSVVCWGANSAGQRGDGTTTSSTTPPTTGIGNFTKLAADYQHTCAIDGSNTLKCWGLNASGQLGDGTTQNSLSPKTILTDVSKVFTGRSHTCAIKTDQTLWCWGANVDGQLGTGSTTASTTPVQIGSAQWTTASLGSRHTCGVQTNGTAWCWGYATSRALGLGSGVTGNVLVPTQVGTATDWSNISARGETTCAKKTTGTLWCWGANGEGQIGDGSLQPRWVPTQVGTGTTWSTVKVANQNTCALKTDGVLWCWGLNANGELGDREGFEWNIGNVCPNGLTSCSGTCVDVLADPTNCGACGVTCANGDPCQLGTCPNACVPPNCADRLPCQIGTCTSTGCTYVPAPNGTSCSDGNACTTPDACTAGACVPGAPVPLPDLGPCMIATCDPVLGVVVAPAPAGTSCSNGNACDGAEACSGDGACLAGTPPVVDDGNVCTTDSCDPILGVVHVPVSAGMSCTDGNLCNGEEICDGSGTCATGTAPAIDDGDACTTDSCDPEIGVVHAPIVNGTTCGPVLAPPPLDPTVAVQMASSTEFLYSGSSPVQKGVAPGTIEPKRVAIVRGRVLDSDGVTPKSGVRVKVLSHPELGDTLRRVNGEYDLAVNGGGSLVLDMRAAGYLAMQRQVQVEWHGWTAVDDVVLTPAHTSPEPFVVDAETPRVVHGLVTPAGEPGDGDDARQAVVVFPAHTHMTNFPVAPGVPLKVQLTEVTRGPQGLQRMPGELPPTSGYTYAFEASIPAARGAGLEDVTFDKDVIVYVDNFTHYPVGEPVPLGYYDRHKGAWMGEKSGRIIKVRSVTGGVATLGVTRDNRDATAAELTELGIDASELQTLGGQYTVGTELWRVTVNHFSTWDANWGFGPPDDAIPPPDQKPKSDKVDCQSEQSGSIIGCESRTLGEAVPIVGTPFTLKYQSDRVPGYVSRYDIPISDASPPQSRYFLGATVKVRIAGREIPIGFFPEPLAPNTTFTWQWDGLDAYGRPVGTGVFPANASVGYMYATVTRSGGGGFGAAGGIAIEGLRNARYVTLWRNNSFRVERTAALPLGFGGWTLDAQHMADMDGQILHYGDASQRSIGGGLGYTIDTVAGGGMEKYATGPASQADLHNVSDNGLARGPDGSLYIAQDDAALAGGAIRRIGPEGTIITLAGMPPTAPKVDGGAALHARIWPRAIALGPDGSVFFAERTIGQNAGKHQVWRISPGANPTLHLVAGNGTMGEWTCPAPRHCGDGGAARSAELADPAALAVARDGVIFIAELNNKRVRRVGPEGTITTYFHFPLPSALSLDTTGALYVQSGDDVFGVARISPDGSTSTSFPRAIENWCASEKGGGWVNLLGPTHPDGALTISCARTLMRRTPDGERSRLAGLPLRFGPYEGDGSPALRTPINAGAVVAGENQELFFYDHNGYRIRRLRHSFAFETVNGAFGVPTADGAEVHEFDFSGRHIRTRSGLTGAARYTFGYDSSTGQLSSVTDETSTASNNVTTITRGPGTITITAPHGQVTTLRVAQGSGYLLGVTNPAGEETLLGHAPDGLLAGLTDPRNQFHRFEYDSYGRLLRDTNALPGSNGTTLSTAFDIKGWTVDHTSPEGRVTRYRTTTVGPFADAAIVEQRTTTLAPGPNGLSTVTEKYADGATRTTAPDGTTVSVLSTAKDPRWGTMASYASSVRTDVGSPTTHSMTRDETRSATLAIPNDPLSVSDQTITTTLRGQDLPDATTTRVYVGGSTRTWTTTSPAGRRSRATLDAQDRVTNVSVLGIDPVQLHPIDYHYDDHGRIDRITQGTRVYETNFDPNTGWVESTSDPANLGVSYATRDANGRPKLVNLPGGRSLAMTYDANGNVRDITPPGKPTHSFAPDETDRTRWYIPPSLGFSPKETSYERDHDGLLVTVTAPQTRGFFEYDALGRTRVVGDVTLKTFDYDTRGRLTSITASGGGATLTYGYDGSLVVQQAISGPFAHAVNKTYDNFFRVKTWNLDGANAISPTYDSDGFVNSLAGMQVTRGDTGLLKTTKVGNVTTLGGVTDAYSYNAYGEVTGHTATVAGSSASYSATYLRDAAGRIDTKTETIGGTTVSERYTYDAVGRLFQVFVNGATTPAREYTYDANGNRGDGTYDAQDRQLTHGSLSYVYGWNGELQTKTDSVASTQTNYDYDLHGNLRNVSGSALLPITYILDGLNHRVGKKVSGSLVQGFVYDGNRIVAELDGSGDVVSRFIYVTSGHSPDLMVKDNVTYRFVKDHLGSPRLVVNTTTGAVAQRMDFDEWGVATDSNPGFQPFGFAGGLYDHDTKLVRFGARDYDPASGRWTSKDSSRFGGGLNFYAYANLDPVNYIDVDGRVPVWVVGIGVAAYAMYLAFNSPTHDGSVVAGAPIMAAPAVGWAAGGALAGATAPAVGAGTLTCGGTATGFLGHRGYQLSNLQSVRNEAAEIGERAFSGHALDQMQNRGILPSVVQNALQNGAGFSTRAGTAGYYDAVNNVSVIVNSETGVVVTVRYGGP